jgi:hypothetical protein
VSRAFPRFRGLAETSPAFRAELWDLAERTKWPPHEVAAVMSLESGFDPRATNPKGGATGLIQWMPDTARAYGTTTDALRALSREEQLPYVERFLRSRPGWSRPGDTYLRVFWSAAVKEPDEFVISRAGEKVYEANNLRTKDGKLVGGLDHDKDGTLTAGDVRRALLARIRAAGGGAVDASPVEPAAERAGGGGETAAEGVGFLAALGLAWLALRKWAGA